MAAARLGEMLVKAKIISEDQLKQALEEQSKSGGRLGYNLAKLNILEEAEIVSFLSKQYGVPSINLVEFEVDAGIIKLIPGKTAKKYQLIPISRTGGTLTLAMADPTNVFALDDIKFMTGYNVEPVVASETAIEDAIMKYYESGG
ncbi:type II secretion system protein GspE, partial [bacterium]|nr:type II secretion system protein GspE [bacterium]